MNDGSDLEPTDLEKFVQLVVDRESQNATYWFEAFLNSEDQKDRLMLENKRMYRAPSDRAPHVAKISERFVNFLAGEDVAYEPDEMVYGRPSIVFQVGTGCFTHVVSKHGEYFRWTDMLDAVRSVSDSIVRMHSASGKPAQIQSTRYGGVYVENFEDVHVLNLSLSD